MDQPPSVSVIIAPCRRTIGCDDSLAALKGFGDDKAEVVGEGREDEHIAPVPDLLKLVAEGVGDSAEFIRHNAVKLGYGFLQEFQALQRMAATEVEEVEGLLDRINRIYRIELEEAFDVGDDDWRTAVAEVGADPVGFSRTCGDKSLGAAEAETLNRSNKPLLPTMKM